MKKKAKPQGTECDGTGTLSSGLLNGMKCPGCGQCKTPVVKAPEKLEYLDTRLGHYLSGTHIKEEDAQDTKFYRWELRLMRTALQAWRSKT